MTSRKTTAPAPALRSLANSTPPRGSIMVDGIKVPRDATLYKVAEIKRREPNPREHPPEEIEALEALILEVGFLVPVLIDRDGVLVAGHARLDVAERLEMKRIPAIRADHLTERQKRLFLVADNRVASLATWSEEKLSESLERIAKDYGSVKIAGFTDEEMERVRAGLAAIDLEVDPDDLEDPEDLEEPEEARSPRTPRKKPEVFEISPALASKLASVVVHADEMLSPMGHGFDRTALEGALRDPEIVAWIKSLGPLAPVKRTKS